jgi:hypothetical protein
MATKPVTNTQRTSVQAFPRETISTPAQTSVSNVAGQLLATNRARRGLVIQNTGTTILYLVLGSATPTSSAYHVALGACASANDGKGGVYNDDAWIGAVQAISSAPGGTCCLTEVT